VTEDEKKLQDPMKTMYDEILTAIVKFEDENPSAWWGRRS